MRYSNLWAAIILAFSFVTITFAEPKIKIGVSTVLSGDAATYGIDMQNAILFANEKFGDGRYELIIEDDKCDPKTAVSIAQKFANLDKVDFVLGYVCSGAMLAAAPILERAKIPTIVGGASAAAIADTGEYIFRTAPSDRLLAIKIAGYIAAKHASVALLS